MLGSISEVIQPALGLGDATSELDEALRALELALGLTLALLPVSFPWQLVTRPPKVGGAKEADPRAAVARADSRCEIGRASCRERVLTGV